MKQHSFIHVYVYKQVAATIASVWGLLSLVEGYRTQRGICACPYHLEELCPRVLRIQQAAVGEECRSVTDSVAYGV